MQIIKRHISLFWIIFSLLLLKTYFVRTIVFNDTNIFKAFLLESGLMAVLLCIFELIFRKARPFLYLFFDFLYSIFLFTVLLYNKQFGRIVNYHSLKNITQIPAVRSSILSLVEPSYLLLFLDFLALPVLYIVWGRKSGYNLSGNISKKALAVVIAFSLVSPAAGSVLQGLDINGRSSDIASKIGLFNYQAFEALTTYIKSRDDKFNSSMEQINDLKGLTSVKNPKCFGCASGKNIIVIQVEALQNFVIGLKIGGREVTPNINRLLSESIYFPKFYSQIAQGNTSDAEFMASTSLYPLENGAVATDYTNKEFPSLQRLLKKDGYENLTFHANWITFWSRDKLYPALGFDKAYDLNFFGFDDPVGIGPSDEVLYRKTADVLDGIAKSGSKFYASIVTLSNHHPFDIPQYKINMDLPDYLKGSFVGDYIQSVNYTDLALGAFLEELKSRGILDNTLLVVYGDHYGIPCDTLDNRNKDLMENILGRPYRFQDTLNVPLIIRLPDEPESGISDKPGGQVDIMPTIANLLGIHLENQIHFGQDLLNSRDNMVGIRYYLPSGSFINSQVLSVKGGPKTDLNTSSAVNKSFTSEEKRIMELETLSDRYIRSLPERRPGSMGQQ